MRGRNNRRSHLFFCFYIAHKPDRTIVCSLPRDLEPWQSSAAQASTKAMRMSASEEAFVPDMDRRVAVNLILGGAIGVNVLGLAIPYLAFFVPPGGGGSGGGVVAKDAIGNEVTSESWLATHTAGSRELTEGIKVCDLGEQRAPTA